MLRSINVVVISSVLILSTTACQVQDKKNGVGDNVRIHTPVGGLEVHTNTLTAAEIGLPVYPGAMLVSMQHNNDSSADVQMSFAGWHLRVRVLNYQSNDPREKIAAFYKSALGQYGDVLTCQNNKAIGELAKTQQGLTCNNDYNYNFNLGSASSKNSEAAASTSAVSSTSNLELRAGSPSNQHLVVLNTPSGTETTFQLINLLAPHGHDSD